MALPLALCVCVRPLISTRNSYYRNRSLTVWKCLEFSMWAYINGVWPVCHLPLSSSISRFYNRLSSKLLYHTLHNPSRWFWGMSLLLTWCVGGGRKVYYWIWKVRQRCCPKHRWGCCHSNYPWLELSMVATCSYKVLHLLWFWMYSLV